MATQERIQITEGAYVFWRFKTAWLDARPLGLGRKSLGTHDQEEAIRKAVETVTKWKSATAETNQPVVVCVPKPEVIIERTPQAGQGELTLWEALVLYEADGRKRWRPSTFVRTTFPLRAFVKSAGKDRPVGALTRIKVREWFDQRVTECSPACANSDFQRISTFCQWMVAEDLIPKNPCAFIKKVRTSTVAKAAPTQDEVNAVIKKAKSLDHRWLADFVVSLAGTGARPQEVLRARACDFDPEKGLLRFVAHEGREIKTKRDRTIAVSAPVKEALTRRKKAAGEDPKSPLFPAPTTYANFTKRVWRLLGKESLKPYDFRHYFCTVAPTWGWSLERVAAYCGNSVAVLERFYQDRSALQLGAPPILVS